MSSHPSPAIAPVLLALGLTLVAAFLGGADARGQGRVAALQPMGVLLPDGDFVYGPPLYGWDLGRYVVAKGGYLARYYEPGDEGLRAGADIVQDVAQDYGISPRLLLALIEMHSGWVSNPQPDEQTYPLGGAHPRQGPGRAAPRGQQLDRQRAPPRRVRVLLQGREGHAQRLRARGPLDHDRRHLAPRRRR